MAEFCFDCWNKLMDTDHPAKYYILSDELDLCEECEQCKPVIIRTKRRYMLIERLKWQFRRE